MAEMTPEERAAHIEALGPPTYKGKTLWFRSDKVLARISAAVQAEHERTKKACAKVAQQHKGSAEKRRHGRGQKLGHYDEDVQLEIRAEERGEDLAADMIATAIRAMPEHDPEREKE